MFSYKSHTHKFTKILTMQSWRKLWKQKKNQSDSKMTDDGISRQQH